MNDEQAVRKIIQSYYDPKGLDYSIGRINMGGCDFSVRKYTYADTEGDVELETFSLQDEDNLHKVSSKQSTFSSVKISSEKGGYLRMNLVSHRPFVLVSYPLYACCITL